MGQARRGDPARPDAARRGSARAARPEPAALTGARSRLRASGSSWTLELDTIHWLRIVHQRGAGSQLTPHEVLLCMYLELPDVALSGGVTTPRTPPRELTAAVELLRARRV